MSNRFTVVIEALDSGFGYRLRGTIEITGSSPIQIDEHYDLESEVRTRLGTGWDVWAGLVDSE